MIGVLSNNLLALPGSELQIVLRALVSLGLESLRVSAFLLSAPLFGARWMPLQVRIILAFGIAAAMSNQVSIDGFEAISLAVITSIIVIELAVGLTAGLCLTIWFSAMLMAGEKIATASGLGFAAQVDPTSGAYTPVVSQILYLFLMVIFVSVDGHLLALKEILQSFVILPIGTPMAPETLFASGISAAGSMFLSACIIMLPITMVLLMVNLMIGIVTRSAPTLNLFSFGFPITLMVVFVLLFFSVSAFAESAKSLIENALFFVDELILGLRHGS